jgi:hypothetical protein
VYDFDLERAGVPNLEAETWRTNATESQRVAPVYEADLAQRSVKVNLKPLEPGVWNEYAISGEFAGLSIANQNGANLSMNAAAVGTGGRVCAGARQT